MNIDEQFEDFLAELGVEMERTEEQRFGHDSLPEVSIFQASRDHYGVFYRLDMVNQRPELRIIIPAEQGETKMDIYLVRLNDIMPLNASFVALANYEGSAAYEQGREAALQHLLYATAEMMKQLFWAGETQYMSFPAEIEVIPLLLNDTKKIGKKRFR